MLWGEGVPKVGGYGNADTYRLSRAGPRIWDPPAVVLDAPTDGDPVPEDTKQRYRQHSVDLTMRGGVTSGVVYPLAVCEIAAYFRVRNVGGASAGAIVAAATAAAELGRTEMNRRSVPEDGQEQPARDREAATDSSAGTTEATAGSAALRIRPGFAGLADVIAWLCQLTPDGKEPRHDEYRLAQLFRPAPADRRVFAVLTAAMRRRLWAIPLLVLLSFGRLSRLLIAALVVAGVIVAEAISGRLWSWPTGHRGPAGGGWAYLRSLRWGLLDLTLFFTTVAAGLIIGAVLAHVARSRGAEADDSASAPPWAAEPAKASSEGPHKNGRASEVRRLLISLALVTVAVAAVLLRWWDLSTSALVGCALTTLLVSTVVVSVLPYLLHARDRHYGLIAGATPMQSRRSFSELLAGTPKPTVDGALTTWLSDCFNQLAGLDRARVLRFGHLWTGRDFERPENRAGRKTWEADMWRLHEEPRRRLVNLELIATDLSRQRPYRFPLPLPPRGSDDRDDRDDRDDNKKSPKEGTKYDENYEELYFDPADLQGIFGADVIEAMKGSGEIKEVLPTGGRRSVALYKLPDPWDMPVIFAVRLSLAMPAFFKAVRPYRLRESEPITDDLGREIHLDGAAPMWPQDGPRAEELWFSDGGITSNFPVHLFDTILPNWSTLALNLGSHPHGAHHQDVWLPQDWEASLPTRAIKPSITGLLGSVVDTARSWRDNMQTAMPACRGRVAWVRQRPDEGGTNLFMPRETIAALTLRGAFAGARLRRRFSDGPQWDRYRWLRLRSALDSLERLREQLTLTKPLYSGLLSPKEIDDLRDRFTHDPCPAPKDDWYLPAKSAYWTNGAGLLDDIAQPAKAMPATKHPYGKELTEGGPQPHPELVQAPPM